MKPPLRGSLPGDLGRMAKRGGTLKDYFETLGLRRFFLFLDYVSDVEPVLEGCDILIRPSRGNDPWGRDVIEAMAHGKPVIATGSYDRFVEDGINGYFFSEYDSQAIAKESSICKIIRKCVKECVTPTGRRQGDSLMGLRLQPEWPQSTSPSSRVQGSEYWA